MMVCLKLCVYVEFWHGDTPKGGKHLKETKSIMSIYLHCKIQKDMDEFVKV